MCQWVCVFGKLACWSGCSGQDRTLHVLAHYFPFLLPQLLWSADADRKQQCSFKGKDPKVRETEGSGQNTEQIQLLWKGHSLDIASTGLESQLQPQPQPQLPALSSL